jgi:enediyne biosynthesis protein E11
MSTLHSVLEGFTAEAASFRDLAASASEQDWERLTPAEPWTVRDQVSHVTFVFSLAAAAASDRERFAAMTAQIGAGGFDAAVNSALALYNQGTKEDILAHFDRELSSVTEALRNQDPDGVVPWLVNPLPPHVLTAAGMIELFAHGQDVADALGVQIERTDRVSALIPFIHRTLSFGYEARGLSAPSGDFRFAVALPSGELVQVGPDDAPNFVCGTAVDLALLATRRRHRDDLALHAMGPDADGYLDVAQAYRGPAGPGRQPLAAVPAELRA